MDAPVAASTTWPLMPELVPSAWASANAAARRIRTGDRRENFARRVGAKTMQMSSAVIAAGMEKAKAPCSGDLDRENRGRKFDMAENRRL
jgi:hypothetical protein